MRDDRIVGLNSDGPRQFLLDGPTDLLAKGSTAIVSPTSPHQACARLCNGIGLVDCSPSTPMPVRVLLQHLLAQRDDLMIGVVEEGPVTYKFRKPEPFRPSGLIKPSGRQAPWQGYLRIRRLKQKHSRCR